MKNNNMDQTTTTGYTSLHDAVGFSSDEYID